MAFLPKTTPLPIYSNPETWQPYDTPPIYTIRFHSQWEPTGTIWPEAQATVEGDLTLHFLYMDGSTNDSDAETPEGALRLSEADERVLGLLNFLTAALQETEWTVAGGRRTTITHQPFEADAPEE